MLPTSSERKTVSIMAAAAIVGVQRRTIYNWMKANKVQYRRTAGGSVRIFVDSLWKETGDEQGSPAAKLPE